VADRRLGGIDGPALATTTAKCLVAGAAVAVVSWLISDAIGWSSTGEALAAALLGGVVGVAVYLGLVRLFRLEELDALVPGRAGRR
jgi:hypothetical protein